MKRPPFDALVAEHGQRVYRVVRAVVGPHDADDAWSETFLSALQAYDRLPADADHAAWLVTIAHRKAIDIVRRSTRLVVVPEVPERGASPREPDLDVRRAIAALPDRQRHAVVLHHLGGLPFTEVAAVVGCSADAARKASSDGVRRLREVLGERDDER